jgi:hypothetical protein
MRRVGRVLRDPRFCAFYRSEQFVNQRTFMHSSSLPDQPSRVQNNPEDGQTDGGAVLRSQGGS